MRIFDGEADRGHLDRLAQLVEIEDLVRIEFAAEEALARREAQEAFGVEPVQGLAQRRATDAETLGKLALVEPFTRLQLIADRHRLELFIDPVDDAVGAQFQII